MVEKMVTREEVKDILVNALPKMMETDVEIRNIILQLTARKYADKKKTGDRIEMLLEELRKDREEKHEKWLAQEKKWDEEHEKWLAQEKKWDEEHAKWLSMERKWDEQHEKWLAQEKKWDEQHEKWLAQEEKCDEQHEKWKVQDKRWHENQKTINEMLQSIKEMAKKHESSIGALGARWGLQSEKAFREGLKSILEESFAVTVKNYLDYDHDAIVFGHPDQVEMDVVIHNGTVILCEIKSSMSKSDMYIFDRKKTFYEKKHNTSVTRMIVISPMIDEKAQNVAVKLGIETAGYADDVVL